MEYTLEDLRGKYVKAGTPEAEIFIDACDVLGVEWTDNLGKAKDFNPSSKFICIFKDGKDTLSQEREPFDEERRMKLKPFTPKSQWSIYTNAKPLCELSDEQAAALFNAWRGGEKIESSVQCDAWLNCMFPEWKPLMVYRIKQKSERELFIESAMQLMTSETERTLEQQFGSLFDSGNFKLVKDGE